MVRGATHIPTFSHSGRWRRGLAANTVAVAVVQRTAAVQPALQPVTLHRLTARFLDARSRHAGSAGLRKTEGKVTQFSAGTYRRALRCTRSDLAARTAQLRSRPC